MKVHELKTWPEPFEAIRRGMKTCEIRKNDRDFKAGDILELVEWDPKEHAECCVDQGCDGGRGGEEGREDCYGYTHRKITAEISHCIVGGNEAYPVPLPAGTVAMSIRVVGMP